MHVHIQISFLGLNCQLGYYVPLVMIKLLNSYEK